MDNLELRMVNELHVPLPVIEWLPLVKRPPTNKGFLSYINAFIQLVHYIIHNDVLPRSIPDIKQILQLSPDTKVGDWFLFQEYKVIRVYGFEE